MLFEATDICKSFGSGAKTTQVIHNVSIGLERGQAVGLVGESGSGKTTLIRCLTRLSAPTTGAVTFDGMDVLGARGDDLKRFRRGLQVVFQDPYSSLNPRMSVEQLLAEGLIVHDIERSKDAIRARVGEMLEQVGLLPSDMGRNIRRFSGGQRQRIAIARALIIQPQMMVCDEPVSALDVSVQAQIIQLLQDMQQRYGLTLLFIAHDLAVVRHLCSEIVVLNKGEVAERGSREEVFGAPQDGYTKALLEAVPVPDVRVARERRTKRLADGLRRA
jgi:oligopeptide transport system ATP-binding protein